MVASSSSSSSSSSSTCDAQPADDSGQQQQCQVSCLPSGTDQSLQAALDDTTSTVVQLCPGSVFVLSQTVILSSAHQTLTTAQHSNIETETDKDKDTRATLILAASNSTTDTDVVVTAIDMSDCDDCELSRILVDGNRQDHHIHYDNKHKELPLIRAGGTTTGQRIQYVDAGYPRGATIIQVQSSYSTTTKSKKQGWKQFLSFGKKKQQQKQNDCVHIHLEHNTIGPAGIDKVHNAGTGVYLDCAQSIIHNNTIFDATDTGMVLGGGTTHSLIQDNRILAIHRAMSMGLALVHDGSVQPGNFTGTVIRSNTIEARSGFLLVALAVGARMRTCMTDRTLLSKYSIDGTNLSIVDNSVEGRFMHYGMAMDGIHGTNITIQNNRDTATHLLLPAKTCANRPFPTVPPQPFMVNWNTTTITTDSSDSIVQSDFVHAQLEMIVSQFQEAQHTTTPMKGTNVAVSTKNHKEHSNDAQSNDSLKVGLLMSFPNSGTSYTLMIVPRVTTVCGGTNYGHETWGNLDPIFDTDTESMERSGPFWLPRYVYCILNTLCCVCCTSIVMILTSFHSFIHSLSTLHYITYSAPGGNDRRTTLPF